MIDLYTFTTPNGRKPAIMLEEVKLPYTVHKVDITKGEQFSPDYIAINPNSKIPALIDRDTDITVFESGAMLIYLAEKTGQFLPTQPKKRYQVIEDYGHVQRWYESLEKREAVQKGMAILS